MSDHGKRSVQVNVRLSEEDFALIKKAAGKLWPSAVLRQLNSGTAVIHKVLGPAPRLSFSGDECSDWRHPAAIE